MKTDLKELLELGQRILTSEASEAEVVALIEEYSGKFADWYQSAEAGGGLSSLEKAFGADSLRELSERHRLIVNKVATLKDGTSDELRKLKRRGKGIMAYTDTLPKRISVRKDRKG